MKCVSRLICVLICDQNHLRSKTKKFFVETNLVKIMDLTSEIFSPHCESRSDCRRNHCLSKTAVNRSVSLQFVYFSLSESLVNYGLESDLSVCSQYKEQSSMYLPSLLLWDTCFQPPRGSRHLCASIAARYGLASECTKAIATLRVQ